LTTSDNTAERRLDALIVGAGFAGLYMLHKLREAGFKAEIIETAPDVGGAWYWNRYPGARCDVESLAYSYSFSPELDSEWSWSERYAAQPEIRRYISFAADRLDLRRDIHFEMRATAANFDKLTNLWHVDTDRGTRFAARFCIMATGPITCPTLPDIPGMGTFAGDIFHTARWPEDHPGFAGQRVGVIGTGSSGVQLIPKVAEQAERLFVFLRTANFTVPARNGPLPDTDLARWAEERTSIRSVMWQGAVSGAGDLFMDLGLRMTRMTPAASFTLEQRRDILDRRWDWGGAVLQGSFKDVMTNRAVNDEVAEFIRSKIGEIVRDPAKAELLKPKGFALGTKRLCVGTDYYETYNRENVEIVDVKLTPIQRVTPSGVVVAGEEIPLDALLLATGFDALTGAFTQIDIRGADGQALNDLWRDGPHTYLGLAIAGFPNFFMIGGPGSPSVFSNVVLTNEFQVETIAGLIGWMDRNGCVRADANCEAQSDWTDHVNEVVKYSLLSTADSWYVGANIPGKARAILAYCGGIASYRNRCEAVIRAEYAGFDFA